VWIIVTGVVGIGLVGCAPRARVMSPLITPAGVRFTFVSATARTVALAASFNGWSSVSHPLVRNGSAGLWTIVTPLPPGEHAYMFVVDGREWVSPPGADDYVDDGFGARNGVLVVRPPER
jgi:1,4-alpha-glucan branching enzyme